MHFTQVNKCLYLGWTCTCCPLCHTWHTLNQLVDIVDHRSHLLGTSTLESIQLRNQGCEHINKGSLHFFHYIRSSTLTHSRPWQAELLFESTKDHPLIISITPWWMDLLRINHDRGTRSRPVHKEYKSSSAQGVVRYNGCPAQPNLENTRFGLGLDYVLKARQKMGLRMAE